MKTEKEGVSFKVESFKEIRNYIHNYLGLTKDEVKEMFREELTRIVKEEVEHVMNDKPRLVNMIHDSIVKEIRRQDNYERHSFTISVMDEIYNRIDNIIHKEVCDKLIIGVKEEPLEYKPGVIDIGELPSVKDTEVFSHYITSPHIWRLPTGEAYINRNNEWLKIEGGIPYE